MVQGRELKQRHGASGRLVAGVVGEDAAQPNKRMQLTKLRAAPVWQAEVPPCAPAGKMDGGTASQLIRRVGQTMGEEGKGRSGDTADDGAS